MNDRKSSLFNARAKRKPRKRLRKSSTAAEAVLWTYIQNRKLLGKKFPYIVDFYCRECRLVVELDGAPHFAPHVDEYESRRTEYLEGAGMKILRFESKAVWENIEFVLEIIKPSVTAELTTPSARKKGGFAPFLLTAHPPLLCEEGNSTKIFQSLIIKV